MPGQYYAARKIYCQFPDEAEWLGVGFLAEVQRKCGVEALEPVIEELSKLDAARIGPVTVADKESIIKRYAKPATKKNDQPATVWRAKFEAERQMRIALEAENKELTEQIEKLKATIRKYEMPPHTSQSRPAAARA